MAKRSLTCVLQTGADRPWTYPWPVMSAVDRERDVIVTTHSLNRDDVDNLPAFFETVAKSGVHCAERTMRTGMGLSPSGVGFEGPMDSASFSGCKSFTEAVEIARGNGPEVEKLVKRIVKLSESLSSKLPTLISRKRRTTWGPEGDAFDYATFDRGDYDECWSEKRRHAELGQTIVELVAPMGGNGGTTTDELAWSAAGVLAAALALRDAGYTVGLRYAFATHTNQGSAVTCSAKDHEMLHTVRVFSAGDELDLNTMAGIAHSAFFRVLMFGVFAAEPCTGHGLGRAGRVEKIWANAEKLGLVPHVSYVATQAFNESGALSQAEAILAACTAADKISKEEGVTDQRVAQ